MATLNSVEFDIIKITTTVIHDNNIMDIPGSDTVVQEDLGYSTAPMRITGHVKNESEYDDFKEQYYSGGELTLIINPDSGKQYTVYALQNLTDLDGNMTYPLSDLVFQAMFFMKNPYLESITDKTRIKSITSNNQEWNADNDGNPLKTDGNVDVVPDIKVTGSIAEATDQSQPNYDSSVGGTSLGQTWTTGTGVTSLTKIMVENGGGDTSGNVTCTVYDSPAKAVTLGSKLIAYSGAAEREFVFTNPLRVEASTQYYMEFTWTGTFTLLKKDTNVYGGGIFYISGGTSGGKDALFKTYYYKKAQSPEIYNTADSTVKCDVANDVLDTAIHRINVDGTGTIDYDDDFTTSKYAQNATATVNVTYDSGNDELDIADDGYIYWKKDTKFPINGTLTLTSRINITAGTPTIQISTDASTWYDIDTAIVDDVETIYPLDSDGNLSLAGKTIFYFRIDCVKAVAATCSIKYFELDINIHTIYAKNPKITKGATASTFRCDQDAASGMACDVELIFPDRWWA